MAGTLTLCGTPIGNLSDLSGRAVETLANADLILAEDTRRTAKLLTHLGISVPMKSFFAGNEKSRLTMLREQLEAGRNIVVVSDAGMPVVSDPGASAVDVAVSCGAAVGVVPGPSAVVAALAVSGFDGDRFVFEGFLPRKGITRERALSSIAEQERTTVLFAAPTRVATDLADLARVADEERRVVVTRELTKVFEEIWRGSLKEAAKHWGSEGKTKGEFTLVVQGAKAPEPSMEDAVEAALAMIAAGTAPSEAVRAVTVSHGVRRNELYEAVGIARS